MRLLLLLLYLGAPPSHATPQDAAAVSAQIDAVLGEYDTAYAAWYADYLAAEGSAEVMERIPDAAPYASRMMVVAGEAPTSEGAFTACRWVVENVAPGEELAAAFDHLTDHFLDRPDIGDFIELAGGGEEAANRFLRGVLERAPSDRVAALACYGLASGMKARLDRGNPSPAEAAQLETEAGTYYAWCRTEAFADVPLDGDRTVGAAARADVFEMENLRVGKLAPEIEGEDLDGVAFKLSDSRGRVVLLDFWGDW